MTGLAICSLFDSEATTEIINPYSHCLQCFPRLFSQSQCWRMSRCLAMSGGREDHVKFGKILPSLSLTDMPIGTHSRFTIIRGLFRRHGWWRRDYICAT